jgi:glycerol-3-phosphate O-acyltransferase
MSPNNMQPHDDDASLARDDDGLVDADGDEAASASARSARRQPTPGRLLAPTGSSAVDDGLDGDALIHPSRMTERFGLVARLLGRVFFARVDYPARLGNAIASCAREGVPVYVMGTVSLLDYLYLNWALLRHSLPRAEFANGLRLAAFQPWRMALRFWWRRIRKVESPPDASIVRGLVARRRSALVFLRRPFSFGLPQSPVGADLLLGELCVAQRASALPIFLVPQILIWERSPARDSGSILDTFFGDPAAPGPIRKALSFARNYRRAFVRGSEPINLKAFVDEQAGLGDAEIAARLLALVQQRLEVENRVIHGATVLPPRDVAASILKQPDFTASLEAIAADGERPISAVRAEARTNLMEIAADLRIWMIDLFSVVLALIWARIYEGIEIDEEGLERIREAGRRGPVVIAPSHKSHIDYLIISYVFYGAGMVPPHIAAGANLAFFPMGPLFRRAGAFFLRRSFRGQPVYTAAFRAYVRRLLTDGHWLEFFIEGTRSRTGKLLPPRYGLLRIVLDAVIDGAIEDVTVVPTNFGYERLIEESAYRKELEGGEKKAEGVSDLLRTTSVLVHKYGRMRIQFAESLSIRALLEEEGAFAAGSDGKAIDRAAKVVAYHIAAGINRAAVLTPTALVAAVLLTKVDRGIERDDLLIRVGYLLDSAMRRGVVLSGPLRHAMQMNRQKLQFAFTRDELDRAQSGSPDPLGAQGRRVRALGEATAELVDSALGIFEASRWVFKKDFEDGAIYLVKRDGRLHLDYYKNNLLHLFVPEALLATALLGGIDDAHTIEPSELRDDTKFLSRMLKFEFIYEPGIGFEAQYQNTLERFEQAGWLVAGDDGRLALAEGVRSVVSIFARLIQNFVESYFIVGRALVELGATPTPERDFLTRCQKLADRLFELGEVHCYEAISKVNLGNALQIYLEQGYVQQRQVKVGKKIVKELLVDVGDGTAASLASTVHKLNTFQIKTRPAR